MKKGRRHYPGYAMERVGEQMFYYCRCLPSVKWNDLDFYDQYYELNHMSPIDRMRLRRDEASMPEEKKGGLIKYLKRKWAGMDDA